MECTHRNSPFFYFRGLLKGSFIVFMIAAIYMGCIGISYAKGPTEVQVCNSCHGVEGQGIEGVAPRLAGLSSAYIANQIRLFQSNKRQKEDMQPMSLLLQNETDIKTVSDHFASIPVNITMKAKRGELVIIDNPAQRIALQGDWSRNIPSCVSCHGPSGIGSGAFPILAGQQQRYLHDQLVAWQKGTRTGDLDNVMGNIAKKLTSDEITAISHYFASIK